MPPPPKNEDYDVDEISQKKMKRPNKFRLLLEKMSVIAIVVKLSCFFAQWNISDL